MLVATHGRALWVLDHLEPIQEYAARAERRREAVHACRPRSSGRPRTIATTSSGDTQYFVGENPPNEAVVQYFLKQPATDLKLRVSDAAGKTVRELTIPSAQDAGGHPDGVLGHAR